MLDRIHVLINPSSKSFNSALTVLLKTIEQSSTLLMLSLSESEKDIASKSDPLFWVKAYLSLVPLRYMVSYLIKSEQKQKTVKAGGIVSLIQSALNTIVILGLHYGFTVGKKLDAAGLALLTLAHAVDILGAWSRNIMLVFRARGELCLFAFVGFILHVSYSFMGDNPRTLNNYLTGFLLASLTRAVLGAFYMLYSVLPVSSDSDLVNLANGSRSEDGGEVAFFHCVREKSVTETVVSHYSDSSMLLLLKGVDMLLITLRAQIYDTDFLSSVFYYLLVNRFLSELLMKAAALNGQMAISESCINQPMEAYACGLKSLKVNTLISLVMGASYAVPAIMHPQHALLCLFDALRQVSEVSNGTMVQNLIGVNFTNIPGVFNLILSAVLLSLYAFAKSGGMQLSKVQLQLVTGSVILGVNLLSTLVNLFCFRKRTFLQHSENHIASGLAKRNVYSSRVVSDTIPAVRPMSEGPAGDIQEAKKGFGFVDL